MITVAPHSWLFFILVIYIMTGYALHGVLYRLYRIMFKFFLLGYVIYLFTKGDGSDSDRRCDYDHDRDYDRDWDN